MSRADGNVRGMLTKVCRFWLELLRRCYFSWFSQVPALLVFWMRQRIYLPLHASRLHAVNPSRCAINDLRIQILSVYLERVLAVDKGSGHNAPHVPGKGGVESNMGVMSISYFF